MHDIIDAETVEITVDQFGKLWVNIDGACCIRVGQAKIITMDDPIRGYDIVFGREAAAKILMEQGGPM